MVAALESAAWAMPTLGVASVILFVVGLVLLYGRAVSGTSAARFALRLSLVAVAVAAQWLLAGCSLAFGAGTGPHAVAGATAVAAALLPALVVCGEGASATVCVAVALLWSTVVFDPLLRWFDHGWLRHVGALDASGALPLHLAGGAAALVCDRGLGRRGAGFAGAARSAPGAVMVALGCAGFALAGAAGKGAPLDAMALASVSLGAAGGALGWLAVGWSDGAAASLSGASLAAVAGVVAMAAGVGLVAPSASFAIGWIVGAVGTGTPFGFIAGSLGSLLAITAAAGYVPPATAIAIGCYVGALCYFTVGVKRRLAPGLGAGLFSVHALASLLGALLTGVFARRTVGGGAGGALFGHVAQLGAQLAACVLVAAYSAAATRLIAKALLEASGAARRRGALSAIDLAREPRAVRSSGVFQSRGFAAEHMPVEPIAESPAADSAQAFKS